MKELSVVVVGNGRWARALSSLLTKNQQKQPGSIGRISQFTPPRVKSDQATGGAAPPRLNAAQTADAEDSTMHFSAGAISGLTGTQPGKPPGSVRAQADDATMMGVPADAFAALAGGISVKTGPVKAAAEDATMTGMTADSLAKLTGVPIKAPGHVKAGSEDATMMGMTADSLAKLAGGISIKAPGQVKAGSEDATMMGMTADSLAKLAGGISIKTPGHVKAQAEDATMMGMTADSLAKLARGGSAATDELRDIASADLIFLAMPAQAVRGALEHISRALRPKQMLVHAVGSLVPPAPDSNLPATLISDLVQQETPITEIGALAGPAMAEDLEDWNPAALVCGSSSEALIAAVRQVLGGPTLRIYGSSDMVGVEVSRAMAPVVAMASGVCDVLEFGIAARAVLVSRGAAEISRLGMAFGAKERTFVGLAGIGGLMVASQRTDSPDFQLGRLLGTGVPLKQALLRTDRVCDSINMIRDTHSLAKSLGLRMPIFTTLHRWLFGNVEMSKAIKDLLEDPNYTE